jgi:hypothetical protein
VAAKKKKRKKSKQVVLRPVREIKVFERKIIQIFFAPAKSSNPYDLIFALADDGTLWWKNINDTANWQLEKPLPVRDA